MLAVGVQQAIPPGRTLKFKSMKTNALAEAENKHKEDAARTLVRNVQQTWLDLFYWQHAKAIIIENQTTFHRLLKLAESQYSAGKATQTEVLQVKLEESRLADQLIQTEEQIVLLHAQLERWLGEDAKRPIAAKLPSWSTLPSLLELKSQLQQHPKLAMDAANVKANVEELAISKEQYKPGWMVGVDYGFRQGSMDGIHRSDMITAQVAMDLPFFTKKRQDQRAKASAYQLENSKLIKLTDYRDMQQALEAQYATWHSFSEREKIFDQRLLPEAKQNAKAALLAYRNANIDLASVLRAHLAVSDLQIQQLQIQVERAKARVALAYFSGEM
jgi:outer membrane protein TolC